MSFRYGIAKFRDGTEAYLVYADSPGWALKPLFPSLEEAMDWRNRDFPEMPNTGIALQMHAKSAEEPVLILADISSPECAGLWFYTTASKNDMVITGPTSQLEVEEAVLLGNEICTKEFYEAWDTAKSVLPPLIKPRETSNAGVLRTRSDGLPTTSNAEICAKWVADQESGPFGIHPLIKGFLLGHPEYCRRFPALGMRGSPSQAKWENISRLMVLANQSRRGSDPVLYPKGVFDAELSPRIGEEFVAFAKEQGISLKAIASRDYSQKDDLTR
ncbi:hypothetical protein DV532_28400 (plasmid) [Pseudomonas sp. Leaf58]|uniref:hypothetical protein n=1 Tax=Pseudomonas sp. Leaf58 TaxID=1736226 RepID=UPI0006F32AB0|nr:hypothetical protein [Pseudomonas sp. Leaf58]AYG48191.1 hypothetical protein DV532_28400 [Pseudomonas sp. Leaf58]KQN62260.1 hypothetical protein ASF02_08840 [Pseudomonas sp. Leaf58]